jgi:hypothetical protein
MGAANPWAFGWTQVFTIVGFVITLAIAFGGFRTFDRWKRERLEEKKIEIAFEMLAIAMRLNTFFKIYEVPPPSNMNGRTCQKTSPILKIREVVRGPFTLY